MTLFSKTSTIRIIIPFVLCIIICGGAFAQENDPIQAIRKHYAEVSQKINEGKLYLREIYITYEVIPAIGAPASRVNMYYDMIPVETEFSVDYDIIYLKIENYFQYAGNVTYEELLYNTRGELLFYFAAKGIGGILSPESIDWNYEESYYFWNNKLVHVVYGEQIIDNPSAQDINKGNVRLELAKKYLTNVQRTGVPQPLMEIY